MTEDQDPNVEPEFSETFEAGVKLVSISKYALAQAVVGDVLLASVNTPLLPEWRECDGSVLSTSEWPEFAERSQIREDEFALPRPVSVLPGHRFIIKLGTHAPRNPN